MTINPWIELPNTEPGMFQLVGHPTANHNALLYGKALLACHEGVKILFIDNHKVIDPEKLLKDLRNDQHLLNKFFVFKPQKMIDYWAIVDDLDLFYIQQEEDPVALFISGIFEFLVKQPYHKKNQELMTWILGHLKTLHVPVFVTNELRQLDKVIGPFQGHFNQRYFDTVYEVNSSAGTSEVRIRKQ